MEARERILMRVHELLNRFGRQMWKGKLFPLDQKLNKNLNFNILKSEVQINVYAVT